MNEKILTFEELIEQFKQLDDANWFGHMTNFYADPPSWEWIEEWVIECRNFLPKVLLALENYKRLNSLKEYKKILSLGNSLIEDLTIFANAHYVDDIIENYKNRIGY
jgi:hypothetical protein